MNYHGLVWAGLTVEDLEASIRFYSEIVGLPLLGQGDDWAHFDAGNEALFELFSGGKAFSRLKSASQQSLVIGLRVDNLDRAITELTQKGVQFVSEKGEFEGTSWIAFLDPEGNQIEIKEIP